MKELLEHRNKLAAMILATSSIRSTFTETFVRGDLMNKMSDLDKLIEKFIERNSEQENNVEGE